MRSWSLSISISTIIRATRWYWHWIRIIFHFASLDSLNDFKTIIIMFADKTFKQRLITNDIIIAFILIVSALYLYIVFIDSRYDDREFKNLLIDHIATIRTSINIDKSRFCSDFLTASNWIKMKSRSSNST